MDCEKIGTLTTKDTKDTTDQPCTGIPGFVSIVSFVVAKHGLSISQFPRGRTSRLAHETAVSSCLNASASVTGCRHVKFRQT
jgi:hypothetical protein